MSDILCIYYSRTGKTRQAVEEIAAVLHAEVVVLEDGVDRSGWGGWIRSGLDAMRKSVKLVKKPQTAKPLNQYRLVIIATPVWAGRCSSVVRGFLQEYGGKFRKAAYVITRSSEDKNEEVFEQMDQYTSCGHCAAVSLKWGSVGCAFWQEEFLRQVQEALDDHRTPS